MEPKASFIHVYLNDTHQSSEQIRVKGPDVHRHPHASTNFALACTPCSMLQFATLCCAVLLSAVSAVSALSIVPKPQYQVFNDTVLHLDARHFNFSATGKDSPLLQVNPPKAVA